jgi:heme/copper-type cytochrome/quinol oxidase subunit 2
MLSKIFVLVIVAIIVLVFIAVIIWQIIKHRKSQGVNGGNSNPDQIPQSVVITEIKDDDPTEKPSDKDKDKKNE